MDENILNSNRSDYQSIFFFIYLFIYIYIYIYINLSISRFLYPSTASLFLSLSLSLYIYLSLSLSQLSPNIKHYSQLAPTWINLPKSNSNLLISFFLCFCKVNLFYLISCGGLQFLLCYSIGSGGIIWTSASLTTAKWSFYWANLLSNHIKEVII